MGWALARMTIPGLREFRGGGGGGKKVQKFKFLLEPTPARSPLPAPAPRLLAIKEVLCQLFLNLRETFPKARVRAEGAIINRALGCSQEARYSVYTGNLGVPRPTRPRRGGRRGGGRLLATSTFQLFSLLDYFPNSTRGSVALSDPSPAPPAALGFPRRRLWLVPAPTQSAQLPPRLWLAG